MFYNDSTFFVIEQIFTILYERNIIDSLGTSIVIRTKKYFVVYKTIIKGTNLYFVIWISILFCCDACNYDMHNALFLMLLLKYVNKTSRMFSLGRNKLKKVYVSQ